MPLALPPNLLQAVRLHYGLSLAALAGYLGVSASLLGMAAISRRELPTAALLRLQPLAIALPPPWSQGAPDPTPASDPVPALAGPLPHPPAPAALRARLATCRHLALRFSQQLGPLLARQAQARHLLAVLPALAAAQPPASDARAARWLPLFEAQARERLGPAASAVLALAQARRLALLAEAAQLAAWLGPAG